MRIAADSGADIVAMKSTLKATAPPALMIREEVCPGVKLHAYGDN